MLHVSASIMFFRRISSSREIEEGNLWGKGRGRWKWMNFVGSKFCFVTKLNPEKLNKIIVPLLKIVT